MPALTSGGRFLERQRHLFKLEEHCLGSGQQSSRLSRTVHRLAHLGLSSGRFHAGSGRHIELKGARVHEN